MMIIDRTICIKTVQNRPSTTEYRKINDMVFNYNPQEKRLARRVLTTCIKYNQHIINW